MQGRTAVRPLFLLPAWLELEMILKRIPIFVGPLAPHPAGVAWLRHALEKLFGSAE